MFADLARPEASLSKRVDPAHTLIVANSDIPLSMQAADWYQARRGVPHRLSIAMGTNTQANLPLSHPVFDAVMQYRDQHRVECVIASADCPYKLAGVEFSAKLGAGYAGPTPWLVAYGQGLWGMNRLVKSAWGGGLYFRPGGFTPLENPSAPVYAPDGKGRYVIGEIDTGYVKNPDINRYTVIPHGCLGFTWSFGAQRLNTLSNIQRMVDDCIWAESQSRQSKKLCLGFGTYTADGSKEQQWYAWQIAKAGGLQAGYYKRAAGLAGIDSALWLGHAEDTPEAAFFAGTGHAEGDVYLGSAVINLGAYWTTPPSVYQGSLRPRRGSWAYNWTSFGWQFVANLIHRGGAAGIGPMFEPFVAGIADDASVMSLALKGYSLAEVAYYSSSRGWAMTAWGDPLYRPFPAYGLPDGESMTINSVTPGRAATLETPDRAVLGAAAERGVTDTTPNRAATWKN